MELILIKQDSAEWNYMWDKLASHPINEGIEDPSLAINEGEGWQYMGSLKQNERVIHQFRHRKHIKFGRREDISFNGSDNLTEADIEKHIPVK